MEYIWFLYSPSPLSEHLLLVFPNPLLLDIVYDTPIRIYGGCSFLKRISWIRPLFFFFKKKRIYTGVFPQPPLFFFIQPIEQNKQTWGSSLSKDTQGRTKFAYFCRSHQRQKETLGDSTRGTSGGDTRHPQMLPSPKSHGQPPPPPPVTAEPQNLPLAKRYAHVRDPHISFDPLPHKYYVHGSTKGITSVTTVIHRVCPEFIAEHALRTMKAGKKWQPGHRHWGQTDAQILAQWDRVGREASESGTSMHWHIELWYNYDYWLPPSYFRDLWRLVWTHVWRPRVGRPTATPPPVVEELRLRAAQLYVNDPVRREVAAVVFPLQPLPGEEKEKAPTKPAVAGPPGTSNDQPLAPQPLHDQSLAPQPLHDQAPAPQPLDDQSLAPQTLHDQSPAQQPLDDQASVPQPVSDDDSPVRPSPPPGCLDDDLQPADGWKPSLEDDDARMDDESDDERSGGRAGRLCGGLADGVALAPAVYAQVVRQQLQARLDRAAAYLTDLVLVYLGHERDSSVEFRQFLRFHHHWILNNPFPPPTSLHDDNLDLFGLSGAQFSSTQASSPATRDWPAELGWFERQPPEPAHGALLAIHPGENVLCAKDDKSPHSMAEGQQQLGCPPAKPGAKPIGSDSTSRTATQGSGAFENDEPDVAPSTYLDGHDNARADSAAVCLEQKRRAAAAQEPPTKRRRTQLDLTLPAKEDSSDLAARMRACGALPATTAPPRRPAIVGLTRPLVSRRLLQPPGTGALPRLQQLEHLEQPDLGARRLFGQRRQADFASGTSVAALTATARLAPLRPFRTEWVLYHRRLKLAGTIDMLYWRRNPSTGKFELVMVDWKRSKELRFVAKFPAWMIGAAFRDLPDTNYSHYCVQLNVYRWLIEKLYGVPVVAMYLAVFHPSQPDYQVAFVPRMDRQVLALFNVRQKEVANANKGGSAQPKPH